MSKDAMTRLKKVPPVKQSISRMIIRNQRLRPSDRYLFSLSEGVVRLERVLVTCPACGEEVQAVARDGRVKGYCAVAKQYVDFLVEAQRIGKNPTKIVKKRWQDAMVSAYLRGDKISVIQLGYGISPGGMYRVLHRANVQLRTKG